MVELQRPGRTPSRAAKSALEPDGHVAQPDRPVPRLQQRPGHDADRVGEVDDPCVRGRLPHLLGDVEHDGDRPQRLGQAAGAGRLLPDAAALERPGLVLVAGRLAAHPQLEQHRVHAVERRLERVDVTSRAG